MSFPTSVNLSLSNSSLTNLNSPNQIDFSYTLIDIEQLKTFQLSAFGTEVSADIAVSLQVDFFASLTLPSTQLDYSIDIEDAAYIDEVVLVGDDIKIQTSNYQFSTATLTTALDISTLAFSTGIGNLGAV